MVQQRETISAHKLGPRVVSRADWMYCKIAILANAIFAIILLLNGSL